MTGSLANLKRPREKGWSGLVQNLSIAVSHLTNSVYFVLIGNV